MHASRIRLKPAPSLRPLQPMAEYTLHGTPLSYVRSPKTPDPFNFHSTAAADSTAKPDRALLLSKQESSPAAKFSILHNSEVDTDCDKVYQEETQASQATRRRDSILVSRNAFAPAVDFIPTWADRRQAGRTRFVGHFECGGRLVKAQRSMETRNCQPFTSFACCLVYHGAPEQNLQEHNVCRQEFRLRSLQSDHYQIPCHQSTSLLRFDDAGLGIREKAASGEQTTEPLGLAAEGRLRPRETSDLGAKPRTTSR